jgi:hypothetical protein
MIRLTLFAVVLMGLAVVTLVVTPVATPAFAQSRAADDNTARSLQGTVTDASDNPVQGAVVQIKDTKTLQIRSFVTGADGMYHFHGLNSNVDYEVRAEHQGTSSSAKTLSSFDSRKSAVINLKLGK